MSKNGNVRTMKGVKMIKMPEYNFVGFLNNLLAIRNEKRNPGVNENARVKIPYSGS